ncbi:MAG TPA: ATP-binding protein [Burkholderiales bacterium]|nr:ATP-binding protein [Burkholderiales bacterium]
MFLAQRAELRRIRSFVEEFCTQTTFPRQGGLRLNVVLEELFVNTVTHGHRGEKDAPVWITLDSRAPGVHVTYEDTAPPFNPLAYTVEMGELRGKIGGLGVLLTRELATAREYSYLFGRNRIRLLLAA